MRTLALLLVLSPAAPAWAQFVGATLDLDRLDLAAGSRRRIVAAAERGDFREVETLLFGLSEADPTAPLLEALGAVLYRNGRYFAAAQALTGADRLAPLDEQSRFTLASAFIQMDRRHWARRELERLEREHPDEPLYPYRLAGVFHAYQRFEEAVRAARRALDRNPGFGPAHDVLGQALEELGRTDSALRAYGLAIEEAEQDEDRAWAFWHRAGLLRELGRLEEAEADLRRAVRLDPSRVEARYELGQTLRERGEAAAAAETLEEAVEIAPGDPKIRYALALCYRDLDRDEAARHELEAFQRLSR